MSFLRSLILVVLLGPLAVAQIVINEIHASGTEAVPALDGDYLELWNQGATPYDLRDHTISIWAGDTGVLASQVIPCSTDGSHIIPGRCFWIFQEGAFVGDPLTGSLAGLNGMGGLPSDWTSSSSVGVRITTPGGVCIAYAYLRRGASAPPVTPPHLVAPCTFGLGNLGTSGTGLGHFQRLTNTNTDSFLDWAHDATTEVGTPGALNTTGAATQTSLGACVPVFAAPAWEANSPECSLSADFRVTTTPSSGPVQVQKTGGQFARVQMDSTLLGMPWDVVVVGNDFSVAGSAPCGPSGFGIGIATFGGQTINLNLMNGFAGIFDLAFTNAFAGPLTLAVGSPTWIIGCAQMIVVDPTHQDGVQLSNALDFGLGVPVVSSLPASPGPSVDDSSVQINTGEFVAGFGTAFPWLYVSDNGRVCFGAPNNLYFATASGAQSGPPFVGVWADLIPAPPSASSGRVTISTPSPETILVDYDRVTYGWSGGPGQWADFQIEIHARTGVFRLLGLNGLTVPSVPTSMLIGISRGNYWGQFGGAYGPTVDAGETAFSLGGPNFPSTGQAMIYSHGTEAEIVNELATAGVTGIRFDPILSGPLCGAYSWTGF